MTFTLASVALVLLDQHESAVMLQLGPFLSSFLGPSPHLSLSDACTLASTSLLDWMWSLSCTSEDTRTTGWGLCNYLRSEPRYYHWQFWKSMKVSAERGDLALVTWLFAHFTNCSVPVEVVEVAAKHGHLDVLQFLLENDAGQYGRYKHTAVSDNCEDEVSFESIPQVVKGAGHAVHWGGRSIIDAIKNGYPRVARWLYVYAPHELNADEIKAAIEEALHEGELEIAEFLVPPGEALLDYAKHCPRPGMIEKLLDSGHLDDAKYAAEAARRLARTERVDLLQRIIQLHSPAPFPSGENGVIWSYNWFRAIRTACKHGNVLMLRCLVDHPVGQAQDALNIEYDSNYDRPFCVAAEGGHIEVMQFLFERGDAHQFRRALQRACTNRHFDAVVWLLQHHDYAKHESVFSIADEAARLGYLEMLEFLYALQTSPVSKKICSGVAKAERKPILAAKDWWFWSSKAMDQAATHGHLAVAQWLDMHRECEIMGCSTAAMDGAASNGHLEVVQWLHAHRSEGCTRNAMDGAAKNGHLKMVQWLHENRSEGCTTKAMDGAAKNGHLGVLKWLHENRPEGCSITALRAAVENGHTRVVYWLRYHFPDFMLSQKGIWIEEPNRFEMLLLLYELFPQRFRPGLPNRPVFGIY